MKWLGINRTCCRHLHNLGKLAVVAEAGIPFGIHPVWLDSAIQLAGQETAAQPTSL